MGEKYLVNFKDEDYAYSWVNVAVLVPFFGIAVFGLVNKIIEHGYIDIGFTVFVVVCFLLPFFALGFYFTRDRRKQKKNRAHNLKIIKNGKRYTGSAVVEHHVMHSGDEGSASHYWTAVVKYIDSDNLQQVLELDNLTGYNMDEGKCKCDVYVWNDEYYVDIATRQQWDKQ